MCVCYKCRYHIDYKHVRDVGFRVVAHQCTTKESILGAPPAGEGGDSTEES